MRIKTDFLKKFKLIIFLCVMGLGVLIAFLTQRSFVAKADEVDYTFEQVPIESIVISCDNGIIEAQPNQSFTVSYEVSPWYTTAKHVDFDILPNDAAIIIEVTNLKIESGKAYGVARITVSDTAIVGSVFDIVASAGNVASNKIQMAVAKIPVEDIALAIEQDDNKLHIGKTKTLKCEFFPSNASNQSVRYELAGSGMKYIESFDDNTATIKAKDNVSAIDVNSSVTVTAYSVEDSTIYDSVTLFLYIPAHTVSISATTPLGRTTQDGTPLAVASSIRGDAVKLDTTVNGIDTQGLNYVISEGKDYIVNGLISSDGTFVLRKTSSWSQKLQIPHPKIKIRVAYGDGFDEISLSIYVPVERIDFIDTAPINVENYRSYDMKAEAFPKYATLLADNVNPLSYSLNGISAEIAQVSDKGLLSLPKSKTSKGNLINYSASLVNGWNGVDCAPLKHTLSIVPVYADGFKSVSILKNGQSITSAGVKVLPSDKLQVQAEFNVDNVTDTDISLNENSNMLSVSGQTISIAQLSAMQSDNPYVEVSILYNNGGHKFNALRNISIYVPAESASIRDATFYRDVSLDLNSLITINSHGYASNKSIVWGTPTVKVGNSNLVVTSDNGKLNITSRATAGTVVKVPYRTYDSQVFQYKEFVVAPLVTKNFSLQYGKVANDSNTAQYDVKADNPQVEVGCSVDMLLTYKGLGGSKNYGLTYRITTTTGKASITHKESAVKYDKFCLKVNAGQSGKDNTLDYTIVIQDGTKSYTIQTSVDANTKTSVLPLKSISIFKRITSEIDIDKDTIADGDTLEICNWDDNFTFDKNNLTFEIDGGKVSNGEIESLPNSGFILTIKASQKYNNQEIAFSKNIGFKSITYMDDSESKIVYAKADSTITLEGAIYTKVDNVQTGWAEKIDGTKKYLLNDQYRIAADDILYPYWRKTKFTNNYSKGSYDEDWMGTDYGSWNKLKSIQDIIESETSFDELKDFDYTNLNITVNLNHRIWGTVEYEIRIFDSINSKQLAVESHKSGNGENKNKSFKFSNISLKDVDLDKILVQVRCKKTVAVWGGELTINVNSYDIEFTKDTSKP